MGAKSLWTFLLLSIYSGCGDLKMEEEATEILSENKNEEHVGIIESADGLQFTQNKPDSEVEATVGFSKQGHVSYKGDFKNDKPHGLWTTFFQDGKPRWQGNKKKDSIMASTPCGMKTVVKEWKGHTKMARSMVFPLAGTRTERNGNINSIISGYQKEPGQPGIIKEILFQK